MPQYAHTDEMPNLLQLSVVLFDHQLTTGQWLGAAVVFSGIGVEAWAKISGAFSPQSHVPFVD